MQFYSLRRQHQMQRSGQKSEPENQWILLSALLPECIHDQDC